MVVVGKKRAAAAAGAVLVRLNAPAIDATRTTMYIQKFQGIQESIQVF